MQRGRAALLEGPVDKILIRKAIPMLLGIAAVLFFNIVDTFYVGQLGAEELAAMSFTFPVTFVVLSLAMGMGIGTTAVISNAIGHGDAVRVRRLTTDGLFLANVLVVFVAALGLITQAPVFRLLGADESMIPLILAYMTPWWVGVGLLVIPMVGNAAIRATGDMKTPSYIMMVAGLANAVLDPLLIFGLGPFPRLELFGAALATVLSWTVAFSAALWILVRREKMIAFCRPKLVELWQSWQAILRVGLPAAGTNVLTPLAAALITRIVAEEGTAAVAAWGVGHRIEGLALVGVAALSTAITPFVGQNLGAGRCDRLRQAVRFSVVASLVWGGATAVLLGGLAYPLARAFNSDPEVVKWIVWFLYLVPISYTLLGVVLLVSAFYNGAQRPLRAALLSLLRLFVFGLPLAIIGSALGGMLGLYVGIAVGNVMVGLIAIAMVRRLIDQHERDLAEGRVPVVGEPAPVAS